MQAVRSLRTLPRSALSTVPRQQRSALRVHAILDAAVRVLSVEGPEAFTTNRVAEVAAVPIGSLYQYFPHKRAILAGILERGVFDSEHLVRAVMTARAAGPLPEFVAAGIEALIDLLLPHRALIDALLSEGSLLGDGSVLETIERTLSDVARDWLLDHADVVRLAHGPTTLWVALNGGTFLFLKWLVEQPASCSREAFVASLTRHVTAGVVPRAEQD